MNKYYRIVKKSNPNGRCIECHARDFCHKPDIFNCHCNMDEQYKYDITAERKEKLNKIKTKIKFLYI